MWGEGGWEGAVGPEPAFGSVGEGGCPPAGQQHPAFGGLRPHKLVPCGAAVAVGLPAERGWRWMGSACCPVGCGCPPAVGQVGGSQGSTGTARPSSPPLSIHRGHKIHGLLSGFIISLSRAN